VHLGTPLPLPVGSTFVQLWTRVPYIQSGASVLGATEGATRSGDRFRMGINHARFSGGEPDWTGMILGNEFQIRRSRPYVARQALSSSTLTTGIEQDLYRMQVSTDTSAPLALHQVQYTLVAPAGSAFTLQYFGFRRGSLEYLSITIVDEHGNDLRSGSLTFTGGDSHRVTVIFATEETVLGSGNVYTLHASPSGVDAGDTLSITLHRTEDGSTGYLTDSFDTIDTSPWGSPGTLPQTAAGFIWSDVSEIPHSDASGLGGGSRDWTDGAYLDDFTAVTTISH
jgi:hypothetical protein